MTSHRRFAHPEETYRFSLTHTLSDYPLLIGEILRRDQHRAMQQEKRRAIFYELSRTLGFRVRRAVGTRKDALRERNLAWHASRMDTNQNTNAHEERT
jgi:hypothetical protein